MNSPDLVPPTMHGAEADMDNEEVLGVEFQGVGKWYGDAVAVSDLTLSVRDGEFLTLLGPSGSGKTTLLKLLAGFENPSAGKIRLAGRDVSTLWPGERNIGMVFQHYALFPHMTVRQNVEYGLRMRRWSRKERRAKAADALELVRLQGYEERRPRELSGGQQQRVALARAIAFGPSVLLMDEPLGALDRALRLEVAQELRRIHRELGTTIVYVTHDQEEALALSERIAIIRAGNLVATGTPRELYTHPTSSFVATFFASHNLIEVEHVRRENGETRVSVEGREYVLPSAGATGVEGDARVAVRPGCIGLDDDCGHGCLRFEAQILETIYAGEATQLICTTPSCPRLVAATTLPDNADIEPGSRVTLYVCRENAVVVPYDGRA